MVVFDVMQFVVLIFCLLLSGSAWGVIVQGGDGSQNTTGTGAGIGWNYVGQINGGAGGVYLGDYGGSSWVLTAGHVGAGSFMLNGVTYSSVIDSAVSLTNEDGTTADLTLFRIEGSPGLTNLTLASTTPTINTSVTMIGFGFGREASETKWDANWMEITSGSAPYRGYKWNGSNIKRWGANTVYSTETVTYQNGIKTEAFETQFRSMNGSAQATTGDSGGGVFTGSGALAGIMIAVNGFSGQPNGTSISGTIAHSETYMADISAYRSEILGIMTLTPVPEPEGLAWLSLSVFALVWWIRTRKAPAAPR